MNKLIFSLLALLISISLTAQKKKDKAKEVQPQEEEEVIEVMLDVEEDRPIYSAPGSSTSPTEFPKNIRYEKKYETYGSLNDDYDWYYEKYTNESGRKYGIVNKSGDVVLPHMFTREYGRGYRDVILGLENNYGLFSVDEREWSLPLEYQSLNRLSNNLFSAKKNGKWGIIDNRGVVIVPFEWTDINSISGLENYVIVRDEAYPNRAYGIYSLTEKKLTVPNAYTYLDRVNRQNYFKVRNGAQYNIIDINNVPRFKQWYDELVIPSRGGAYIVKKDNRYGIIDDNENIIVPIEYMEIKDYPFSDGSYLARNKAGKYGCIQLDGRVTLAFEYDNLSTKYNDNVISVQNGKCGLIHVNAGVPYEIVTCNYDDIKGVSKTFVVEKEGKFGMLNEFGKPMTDIAYQSLDVLNANTYQDLIIKAKRDNEYLLLNEQGQSITTSKYKDIDVILDKERSDSYRVTFSYLKAQEKNKKYSIIDKVGKPVTKAIFDDILSESQNVVTVKSNGKYGLYYILDQKLIVDYSYDQIVNAKGYFVGLSGTKMDLLYVKSGAVVKTVSSEK